MELNTFWRYRFWLFVLPDIGTEIASYRKEKLDKDAEAEEKNNYFKISESKASVSHIDTTLKAYALFEKM
jgi:preprotein translocase subunit SecA